MFPLAFAQVGYDMLYPVKLNDADPETKLTAELAVFVLFGPNMSDPVITSDTLCAEHCDGLDWCIAHDMEGGYCQHIADRSTLNMEVYGGANSVHNFDWRITMDAMMYLDDNIYRYLGHEFSYDYGIDGPHRIDPRRIQGDRNRKVVHPEPVHASMVYTKKHLKPHPLYKGHVPSAATSTQWFHGYPVNGIKRVEPTNGPHGVRTALHETMRLGVHGPNDGGAAILDPVHKVDHRYFFITHTNDAGTKTYLNCQYKESDHDSGCMWGEVAAHKWSFSTLTNEPGPGVHTATLQAHDINTGAHQGYLDVSRCNTDPSAMRLLPNGIHSSDTSKHCGIGKFFPGTDHVSWQKDDLLYISKDARMCKENECGGRAIITLETETLDENPDKFKYIRYENGSYVHCYEEGTIEEARSNTLGKFCRASQTPTQMFAVEWNYNQFDMSAVPEIGNQANIPMCITIWEINASSNTWENTGSLAYGEYTEAGIRLPYKSTDLCNQLDDIREEDVMFVDEAFGGFTSRLYESTTVAPGLVEVNVTQYLILDPNAFKNLTAESVVETSNDNFLWTSGNCPADHYVSRVSPLGHVGCRKVNQYGTLGAQVGTTVDITSGSFGNCENLEHVVVSYIDNQIQCAPITVDDSDIAGSGPELPYVGTMTVPDKSVDNTFVLDHKTWKGTPVGAIIASEDGNNKLDVFHYGTQCHVSFGDKDTSGLTNDAAVKPGPSEAARCRQANEYVTHVQCFESDCRQGVNITCQSADGCAVASEAVVRDHFCHHDEVVVGIECGGSDDTGDPCPVLLMHCAAVTADATLRPSIPGRADDEDEGSNVALIVGGVGGFTLFLLVVTTLCVCFGPDQELPQTQDVIDSEAIINGAKVDMNYKLPSRLKYRKTEVKFMF
jgi:hypothetical protein